jgi:hypothetical protein
MSLLLAVPVAEKIAPDVAGLAKELSSHAPGAWRDAASLLVGLASIDEDGYEGFQEGLFVAIDKAAAAHQGFVCGLAGVKTDSTVAGSPIVRLAVPEKEGMLKSLMESVMDRAPAAVSFRCVDPWRSELILGELTDKPAEGVALAMEAAAHGKSWDMKVKKFYLVRSGDSAGGGSEILHEATLPAS